MGKAIYEASGKAEEYSKYACNLYNGCPNKCEYCFNRVGLMKGTLGGDQATLKVSLVSEEQAYVIFCKELLQFKNEILKSGALHFNFVSDPCLENTISLNFKCIDFALSQGVPVQILTKKADWYDHPAVQNALQYPDLVRWGFSLTGADNLEPGASPNLERVTLMQNLHETGHICWASIEPILNPQKSFDMIVRSFNFCDHFKIGVLSGKKDYTPQQIQRACCPKQKCA